MARLMDMDYTMDKLRAYADRKHEAGHTELANGILKAVNYIHNEVRRVDAVEVVHGKAVPIRADIDYEDTLIRMDRQCNRCGALITQMDNFCPNCGAKMDGGAE